MAKELIEIAGASGRRVVPVQEYEAIWKKKGYVPVDAVPVDDPLKDEIADIKKMTIEELEAYVKDQGLDVTLSNYSKKKEMQNAIIDVISNKG